jgi:hypothetical protein
VTRGRPETIMTRRAYGAKRHDGSMDLRWFFALGSGSMKIRPQRFLLAPVSCLCQCSPTVG